MSSRVFVVVPVYNEKNTVEQVLSKLTLLGKTVDEIVVVDDGSSDGSGELIDRWAKDHHNITVLHHETNRGYSEALLTGFGFFTKRFEDGKISEQDILVTLDADGQHDPAELPRLLNDMETQSLDVLWGRRDFSLYPLWKRMGNRLMSLIAWVFSGHPFKDVESGYCLFRLGALSAALKCRTRDWRYSISLTLAVILARLGYRISNEPTVSIPLYRSRTRILDVFTDTMAAANAWAAVTFAPLRKSRQARIRFALGAIIVAFIAAIVVAIAIKYIFLGFDSINNYVHVWYISHSIFYSGSIPARIPWLENGQALTYPYAFLPWTFAALLYRVVGDYAVTWTIVLGFVLLVYVVYKTRLRNEPWLFIIFLVYPVLIQALLSFEMAFIWGALFGYLYIYSLEKNSKWWALLWWVLALSTHMLVVGSLLMIYNIAAWFFYKERRRFMLQVMLMSLPALVPVVWYSLKTPAVETNSAALLFGTTLVTVVLRGSLFFMPFLLIKAKKWWSGKLVGAGAALFFGVASFGTNIPFISFATLVHQADDPYKSFLTSSSFQPGATYRILEASDREQGHYFLPKHGAVLSQELFSESQQRHSWKSQSQYRAFLTKKKVDYVLVNRIYFGTFHTNEQKIIDNMIAEGLSKVVYQDTRGRFKVFDVREARLNLTSMEKSSP